MLLCLHDGSYMFHQNNAVVREQLGSFPSYFSVNMIGGKSWNATKCIQLYILGSVPSQFSAQHAGT
jgi:hypothetical protein